MKLMFLEMLICRYIIFVWCLCKFENVLNYNIRNIDISYRRYVWCVWFRILHMCHVESTCVCVNASLAVIVCVMNVCR
jgi:hypothetical protein